MYLKSTNYVLIFGLMIAILLTANGRPQVRKRRQTNMAFKVISNSSFPCTEVTSTATPESTDDLVESSSPVEPLSLNWNELAMLTEASHVSNDGTLTATTAEQTESFPNIIPVSNDIKVKVKQELNLDPNGILLKREIVQYLKKVNTSTIVDSEGTEHMIKKRDTSKEDIPLNHGAQLSMDYCFERGTPTLDSEYLYMCTLCSKTSDLGEDFWPRYVNEAECDEFDNQCLVVDTDFFHGKCQSISIPLNVLRKRTGYCALALLDGQTVIVEDWEPTTIVIKVGCECIVDAESFFANFL